MRTCLLTSPVRALPGRPGRYAPRRDRPEPPSRADRGATTSEYATGTVGAACMGCALWWLADDGWFASVLTSVFAQIETRILPLLQPLPPIGPVLW